MGMPLVATLTLNPSLDEGYTLDRLLPDELNRAKDMQRDAGGKGINVSRVVRELGGRTVAYGFAGGRDGQWLRDALDQLGVPHHFTPIRGTTRNNITVLTRHPRRELHINTPGPQIAKGELRALRRTLETRRSHPAWLVCSGSLPPGVPLTIYRSLSAWAHRHGIACALDAEGAPLAAGLAARPDLIKPNRIEAQRLLRRPLSTVRAVGRAAAALARRAARVIISLGRSGAVLAAAEESEVWMAHSPAVRVQSTIGAGDSLVAGALVGLTRGWPLVEAFRLGVACGAACAMTPGTALCHRADVERLLPRVRLHRVSL